MMKKMNLSTLLLLSTAIVSLSNISSALAQENTKFEEFKTKVEDGTETPIDVSEDITFDYEKYQFQGF